MPKRACFTSVAQAEHACIDYRTITNTEASCLELLFIRELDDVLFGKDFEEFCLGYGSVFPDLDGTEGEMTHISYDVALKVALLSIPRWWNVYQPASLMPMLLLREIRMLLMKRGVYNADLVFCPTLSTHFDRFHGVDALVLIDLKPVTLDFTISWFRVPRSDVLVMRRGLLKRGGIHSLAEAILYIHDMKARDSSYFVDRSYLKPTAART